jgi:hypothetical protein
MDTREVNQLVEKAVESISTMTPGTTVSHLVLGDLLKADRKQDPGSYYSRVGKVRKDLMQEHGIFLQTEHKIGYTIVVPGKEIDHCRGDYIRGYKKMVGAVKNTSNINMEKIKTEADRRRTIEGAQQMASMVGMLRMGTGEVREAIKK